MRVGFIGTGNMGAPMARNLARAGHSVRGFDLRAGMPDGVEAASSIASAVEDAEVVVAMLPDGRALRNAAAEAISRMAEGATLMDCSTADMESTRAVAAQCTEAGCGMLDAPVSGGIGGAEQGTLTFMVGGDAEALDRVRPLLDAMGKRIIPCGPVGSGQAAKLCNNLILGATMAATCESFALAKRLGLDAEALFDVVSTSSGQSWSTTTYCPVPGVGPRSPADNEYRPGFAAGLMTKDLQLAIDAAAATGSAVPMAVAAIREYIDLTETSGGTPVDFSALYRRFVQRA